MAEGKQSTHARLNAVKEAAALHTLPSYTRFLFGVLRAGRPYVLYARLRNFFLPTVWVMRALRIARRVLLLIETSAVLLLAAAILLALLPVALIFGFSLLVAVLRERRRTSRVLAPQLTEHRVVVLFENSSAALSFLSSYIVLVVTDDLPTRSLAAVAFRSSNGVLFVRTHYYFHLRRTLLQRSARTILLF